jgi:hypothetical protein
MYQYFFLSQVRNILRKTASNQLLRKYLLLFIYKLYIFIYVCIYAMFKLARVIHVNAYIPFCILVIILITIFFLSVLNSA